MEIIRDPGGCVECGKGDRLIQFNWWGSSDEGKDYCWLCGECLQKALNLLTDSPKSGG